MLTKTNTQKSKNRARFKEFAMTIKKGSQKSFGRQTIMFTESSKKKKNLAYYDIAIYNTLKLRKQSEVILLVASHFSHPWQRHQK
jgi:hypothetical protein